jgi:hypothetical protein
MYECSKASMRRLRDSRFASRYFFGNGIDIGELKAKGRFPGVG